VSALTVAAVGHGTTSLWYLTRATGLVALVLLSAAVVVGIVCSVGWATERWPRFASQSVHRNVSLLAFVFVVVHVVSSVADGYVPLSLLDAIVPFRTPYRTLWVGLGACAFDLMLAVAVTSGLRRRIGVRLWRAVHWLAYACWPIALFHALGAGSDGRLLGAEAVYVICIAAVLGALGWRIALAATARNGTRVLAAVVGGVVTIAAGAFALTGPMQPGWSKRAGTSSALLAQLARARTAAPTAAASSGSAGMPRVPFTSSISGTYSVRGPDATGNEQVVFTMRLSSGGTPLTLALDGTAVDGGVSMASGVVSVGGLRGPVTSLEGSDVGALVSGSGRSVRLAIELSIDRSSGGVAGMVSATRGANGAVQR
jgi:DMSO/TMAO reductase YedYZ heme-binding membrane subunit